MRSSCTDPKEEEKLTTNSTFENSASDALESTRAYPSEDSVVAKKWQRDLDALEAVGFKTQAWKSSDSNDSVLLPTLDINWLIAQPTLPYLVQLLPTHLLHRSLQNHGLEDSLEVIDCIRGDALVRLLDYELWTSLEGATGFLTPEEDLSADRFVQWIKLWNEISPEFAAERLLELDEGVIVGCLTALCEIIPVGLNRHQEELNDDYWMTPDNKFGLKIKTTEQSDFEILYGFIHSLYSKDIRTAQQVLAHSAMIIREEALEEARRWRQGRLEDQGFLSADEARSLLSPKNHKEMAALIQIALKIQQSKIDSLPAVSLANSDSKIKSTDADASDTIRELMRNMDQEVLRQEIETMLGREEVVRLVGSANIQTELFLDAEEVIETFVEKVVVDTNNLLARLESHNAKALKLRPVAGDLLFDRVMAKISEYEPSLAIEWKSRLARTTNGVSVALGVSNEASELGRVLSAVRGCLNIGLEKLLKAPESFGINWENIEISGQDDGLVDPRAVALVKAVGPEALFQVGWQALQELARAALESVVFAATSSAKEGQKLTDAYSIRLSDGESVSVPVIQLLNRGRYLEVRKWLQRAVSEFDPALQHVLLSTVNRLPVFPIILLEENGVIRGSTIVKPYEVVQEIDNTMEFLSKLSSVVRAMSQGD